ncbi:MAG: TonB-dependent receptor [Pseudomonadota bacterium]
MNHLGRGPSQSLRGATLGLLLSPVAMALAQGKPSAAPTGTLLEEVIVSAQKRSQSLTDVPMSIGIMTADQVERAQLTSVQDISVRIPGLAISQFGGRGDIGYLSIRGLANNSATQTLRAAVIVDDVPITDLRSLNSSLLDVEQIEVLRGPQSTLYGLTAEAGLMVTRSRRPQNTFGGRLAARYSSFEDYNIQGVVDIPLIDNELTLGLSGLYESRDGFVENQLLDDDYDKGETQVARVRALYTPTDQLELDFIYTYDKGDDDFGQSFVPVNEGRYRERWDNPVAAATSDVAFETLAPLDEWENAADWRGFAKIESHNFSLRAAYEFSSFELVSVSSYREGESDSSFDIGIAPGGLLPFPGGPSGFIQAGETAGDTESFYQELRAVSSADGPLDWVVGAVYFNREDENIGEFVRTVANIPPPPFPPIPADTPLPFGDALAEEFTSLSIYGQIDYRLSDRWELTAGLRYEDTESTSRNLGGHDGSSGLFPPTEEEINDDGTRVKQSSDNLLPKLTLSYLPNDSGRVYATLAKGWLPGSGNADTSDDSQARVDEEESWTYELGANYQFAQARATLSAALFFNTIDDYQEVVSVGPLDQRVENVDEVEIRGFEVEATWSATDRLRLSAGYARNEAEYGSFVEDYGTFGRVDRKGNRLPGVPEYNFNISAVYDWSDRFYTELEVFGAGSFLEREDRTDGKGTQLLGVQLQPALGETDSYEVVNLRAGYDWERVSLLLFVNNLLEERYFTLVNNTFAFESPEDVYLLGTPGESLEFGASLSFSF